MNKLISLVSGFVFVLPTLMGDVCAWGQDGLDVQDIAELIQPSGEELLEPYEYQPNPHRVRILSEIGDDVLRQFQHGKPILIHVPTGNHVVSAIRIARNECFKSDPLRIRPQTKIKGDTVVIPLSHQSIEWLDYQPIDLVVYQSNIKTFQIVPVEKQVDASLPERRDINPDFYVRIKPKNGVPVAFVMNRSFRLTNDVFDVELPFDEIDGIFFNDGEEKSASIVLANGDNLTGKHYWPDKVEFETPWGNETIELDQVISVTRQRSVRLVSSGAENPRWVIVKEPGS